MKFSRLRTRLVGLAVATILTHSAQADPSPPQPAAAPLKLLFSGADDVADAWGELRFGVSPVRQLASCESPGFTIAACFPRPDGTREAFGQQMTETKPGSEPWLRLVAWRFVRAITRDGRSYTDHATLLEETSAWTDHIAVARNGDTGEYLALKLKVDNSGFAYTAFFSPDGKAWRAHPGNPLFYDGDAMSLFWSPVLHRFVCVNKSLQPHRKRILDHGGATPALGDETLRDRRVLMMRSSADGRHWEPQVSMNDVWNRNQRKSAIPSAFFTVPDAGDPPDLEFYSGNAFWYHDRAYMMVLNYAASPLVAKGHGPQLDNEWWTSRDGLRWERPARGVNVLDAFPAVPRLETPPMVLDGKIVFSRGTALLGMTEDRITCVTARANAEFNTRSFVMPAGDLHLNAAVPSPERSFAKDSAYASVAILDATGSPVAGFEGTQCVIRDVDRRDIPLKWAGRSARELAGKTLRLRIRLRSASIYAVTAK